MDWHRHADAEAASGVVDLVRRLVAAVGPPVRGSRLLERIDDLLARTREIESRVAEVPTVLRVGFQTADRFDLQRDRDAVLAASGTRVVAFGRGRPAAAVPGVEWVALDVDGTALPGQWHLVAQEPHPALVAFETDRRPDGARRWEGFCSEDPKVVHAIASHLDAVRGAVDGSGAR